MVLTVLDNVISDRGSRYAVSGGPVSDKAGAAAAVAQLRQEKRFARATHNSWAVLLDDGGAREGVRHDDGETGAGAVILRMLEREGLVNHIVIVTRWYGGVKLGGDRFRHVTGAVRTYLAQLRDGR